LYIWKPLSNPDATKPFLIEPWPALKSTDKSFDAELESWLYHSGAATNHLPSSGELATSKFLAASAIWFRGSISPLANPISIGAAVVPIPADVPVFAVTPAEIAARMLASIASLKA